MSMCFQSNITVHSPRGHYSMMPSDVCLSHTSGLTREWRGLGRLKLDTVVAHVTRDSDTTFKVKFKGKLVADVLNSQHARTGATWRINTKILSSCRPGWGHILPASRTARFCCFRCVILPL